MASTAENKEKMKDALNILSEAAKDEEAELKRLMKDKYGNLKSLVTGMEKEAESKAYSGFERVKQLEKRGEDKARESAQNVDQCVHEQPWKAMGYAAVGALVLGYLMGRK